MILPKRLLGSTELNVSALGLGTVKLGRNTDVKYPHKFEIPDDKQAANLLAFAKDLNINMLDTAPSYGDSETRLGKLLKGQRQQWIIVGKAGEEYEQQQSQHNFTRDYIIKSIQRSLKRLNTDYIDLLLIHSDGNDEEIIKNHDIFNTMAIAKQQGLIRYAGMSTKTVTGGILALQNSDVAMITYNPINTEELPVIKEAQITNKGILIKKGLASGHIDQIDSTNPVQTAMNFIFQEPGVNSIILGTINPKHLENNVQCAINALV